MKRGGLITNIEDGSVVVLIDYVEPLGVFEETGELGPGWKVLTSRGEIDFIHEHYIQHEWKEE